MRFYETCFPISRFSYLALSKLFATVFGTVRGHRSRSATSPRFSGIQVVLKAKTSEFTLDGTHGTTRGNFTLIAVPIGEYNVSINDSNFVAVAAKASRVLSGTAPILHFELRLPLGRTKTVVVSADAGAGRRLLRRPASSDRLQIQETPGASRTNSLAMITDYVPGAYFTHDQLHVRGGHQVSWAHRRRFRFPTTNIASNLGPQARPKRHRHCGSATRELFRRLWRPHTTAYSTSPHAPASKRNNDAETRSSPPATSIKPDDQFNFTAANGNRLRLLRQRERKPHQCRLADSHLRGQPTTPPTASEASLRSSSTWIRRNQLRLIAQARRDFLSSAG